MPHQQSLGTLIRGARHTAAGPPAPTLGLEEQAQADLQRARERFPVEEVPVGRFAPVVLPLDPPAEEQTPVSPLPPPTTVAPAPPIGTLPPSEAAPGPLPPAPSTSGTLQAAVPPGGGTPPPSLGGLIPSRAPPGLEVGPKPQTPEAHAALASKWESFFNKPETRAALIQFGVSMLQAGRPGSGFLENLGRSAGEASEASNRATLIREAEAERARKAGIEEREISVKERKLLQGGAFERKVTAIAKLTGLQKSAIAKRLLLGKPQSSEFFTIIDELDSLFQEGRTPENDRRARLLQDRADKLTSKSGKFIEFTKDGIILREGDVGAIGQQLTAARQLDQVAVVQELSKSIDTLTNVIAEIDTNPTAFGAAGTARRFIQKGVGTVSSVGGGIGALTGGIVDLEGAVERITGTLDRAGLTGEFEGFFDPQLSKTQLLENTLAFDLARLRLLGAAGKVRALKQVFLDAKDNVQFTGAFGPEDVRTRMVSVRNQFLQARADALKRLSAGGAQPRRGPSKPVSDMTDEELQRATDALLGTGGR